MENILAIFNSISDTNGTFVAWFLAVGGVILALKPITILTPTRIDDKALGGLGKIYNLIAKALNLATLNIGRDKNADDVR